MKLIKITTDNEISVHEFPEGNYSEQNEALADLIGPKCRLCEHVMMNWEKYFLMYGRLSEI